jgi:hypothetical protein
MTVTSLIGRDDALGPIQVFLAAVERGPAALVLSGEPGIDKTVLGEESLAMANLRFVPFAPQTTSGSSRPRRCPSRILDRAGDGPGRLSGAGWGEQ